MAKIYLTLPVTTTTSERAVCTNLVSGCDETKTREKANLAFINFKTAKWQIEL